MDIDPTQAKEVREAEAVLVEKGFVKSSDGRWIGHLTVSGPSVEVSVTLPAEFPYRVPEISIDPKNLPRRIPHVERNGKLCIIPTTGVLIDSDRPRDIVTDCLARAEILLRKGLSGANEADLIEEFLAYWNPSCDGGTIRSICTAETPSREICLLHHQLASTGKDTILACDNSKAGGTWLSRASTPCKQEESGWLHFVSTSFPPPNFNERLLTRDFVESVKAHSADADCQAFKAWLAGHGLPCTVVCCMRPRVGESPLIFAVTFNRAVGKNRQEALKGYRKQSLPTAREFAHTLRQPITRLAVDRLDWEYLLPRAGGSIELRSKTVAVVGCGSVGSLLAEKLACLGVGTIRLVDNDALCPANVHRHVLGVEHLGKNKAAALSSLLERRFPHVTATHKAMRVQSVLIDEPEYLLSADLVCIALGDETTELWLNDCLRNIVPRLHAWVEPLGIGGHVLVAGLLNDKGCYRCLFQSNAVAGLHNTASFAKAGQTFTRSFAGCAGRFTPFAYWDADRTASEAARCALAVLSDDQQKPMLLSWCGDPAVFLGAGFVCSQRSAMFAPGEVKRVYDFAEGMCRCNKWTKTA
ncbi:MAG: ThiF family adenylyltransferase [Verrucomicrobia bacterium]|nr:ThiF family adenylyltransferase [Verrucomicrobiota bacterium]MBU1857174.1 ThiF family adenylyltransferase [Verrucomicrobiota bacterium]